MVDDAHATGVLGAQGRGTTEHFGLQGRVPIQMGTLGKSLGSFGAYIAGSRGLIALLVNRSRSYVYSTSLPPAVCAASLAAIGIVEREPQRRADLWKNRERFLSGLRSLGIGTGASETPIVPLMVGNSEKAMQAGTELFHADVYALAIRPPTVPEGTARIRMTLMSDHSDRDIDTVLDVLHKLKKEGLFS